MATSTAGIGFGTPFQAQLDFFRAKLNLPSERWDDIWQQAHDRAFIVAGAMKADLLSDLHGAVEQSVAGQLTYQEFHKQFLAIAKAHGWINWTGSGSEAGQAWRTRIVYQTNLLTSHAAGRYSQLTNPSYLKRFPYWVYHHRDGVAHPRPLHVSWDGLTLHHSHPFWQTHFPPNGWLCHCWVTSTDEAGYQQYLANGGNAQPPDGWDSMDAKTGAPIGIDKGWAYAPGANARNELRELVQRKLINLDAPIGADMWKVLAPIVQSEIATSFASMVQRVSTEGVSRGQSMVVGALKPQWVSQMEAIGAAPQTAEIAVRDEDILHTFRDAKAQQLDLDWYTQLPSHLQSPSVVILDQSRPGTPALLLIYSQGDGQKLVIVIDYKIKKPKSLVNVVRSGASLDAKHLESLKGSIASGEFTLIEGGL